MNRFVRIALFLMLAMLQLEAFAQFSCTASQGALTFPVPSRTYAIPRDTPPGSRITPWTTLTQAYGQAWSCYNITAYSNVSPFVAPTLAPAAMTYTESGITYMIFPTNLAGVGLVMKYQGASPSGWVGSVIGVNSASWSRAIGAGWASSGNTPGPAPWGFGMAFAFVKTGPITPGAVTMGGTIATTGMAEFVTGANTPLGTPLAQIPVTVTGSPVFQVLACTTPDVTVNLRTHRTSELSGVGATTTAVAFNISLNNCPAGLGTTGPAIRYEIDPTTTLVNSSNAVVALNSGSTASGMGVQLLNSTGTPFPLGKLQTFSGYNASTGGSYTIPLQARYYQTGSSVTPGTANSAMTFTMTYQ